MPLAILRRARTGLPGSLGPEFDIYMDLVEREDAFLLTGNQTDVLFLSLTPRTSCRGLCKRTVYSS